MAGEEVVNDADHFLVEAKHPSVTDTKRHGISVRAALKGTIGVQTHSEIKLRSHNSQLRPAYLSATETVVDFNVKASIPFTVIVLLP